MAFPSSLDSFTPKQPGQTVLTNDVNDLQTAVQAIQAKVGTTGSTVATSLDYLISQATIQIDPTDQFLTLT